MYNFLSIISNSSFLIFIDIHFKIHESFSEHFLAVSCKPWYHVFIIFFLENFIISCFSLS